MGDISFYDEWFRGHSREPQAEGGAKSRVVHPGHALAARPAFH